MARGNKGSCTMVVQTDNGKDSILHKELQRRYRNRPFINYIYAHYSLDSVKQAMDNAGYKRNNTNEHEVQDVIEFLHVNEAFADADETKMIREGQRLHIVDPSGNLVEFTDSETALNKAIQYNSNNHPGSFAMVIQNGDNFSVKVVPLDSSTHTLLDKTTVDKQAWDITKNTLQANGIDITSQDIDRDKFNTTRAQSLADWMYNINKTNNNLLLVPEIKALLSTQVNSSQVQRLLNQYGQYGQVANTVQEQLDNVAKAIYDYFRNNLQGVTPAQSVLINSTIDNCKDFNGVDLNTLKNQVEAIKGNYSQNSVQPGIKTVLQELNRKYKIDAKELESIGKNINSLQQAAERASFTLKRQLSEIKYTQGVTSDAVRIEQALDQLMTEIANNRYTQGLIAFLQEAKNQLTGTNTIKGLKQNLANLINVQGTAMEKGKKRSDVLTEAKRYKDGYVTILERLINIDQLQNGVQETIDPALKSQIEQIARELFLKYKELEVEINRVAKETFTDLSIEYLGDNLYNGIAVANIVEMQDQDSTLFDHLYSISRASNPIVNVMGNMIETMRVAKDAKMRDIALRIRRERSALRKAGMGDEWMYGDDGYIISEYDIPAYNRAKQRAWGQFKRMGLTGLRLDAAMENWVEQNSEEVEVDFKNGRKERVPGLAYRRPMPQLNAVQQRYYNNMMQIKGELGSMLPAYAQRQFVPPQLRKTWTDGMMDAMKNKKGIRGVIEMMNEWVRVTKNKVKGLWHVWEDDTDYIANGILQGEDINIVDGAMDNTPFRRIPIYYINRLEDQRDLLKDFAGALQHLAATAINYECVNDIKNTFERMGDYLSEPERVPSKNRGVKQMDVVESKKIRIFRSLSKKARQTNNAALIDAWTDKHIYGIELKNQAKYTKFLKNMLAYNSMRKLTANVKGALNNYIVGEYQMLREAMAGSMMSALSKITYKGKPLVKQGAELFTLSDYIWAHSMMFANNASSLQRLVDFTVGNKSTKPEILAQFFDPEVENFNELGHERYYRTWLRRWLSKDRTFVGYGIGEHLIHRVVQYSVLKHLKVRTNGKETSLHRALYVKNIINGNGELGIRPNTTFEMPDGTQVPVDMEFLEAVKGLIRYGNQCFHGSMSTADKGVIHQQLAMRYIMNLRQWMVEHYSSRFRNTHYDASLHRASQKLGISKVREGHQGTAYKMGWNYTKLTAKKFAELGGVAKFLNSFGIYADRIKVDAALRWKQLRPDQQQNALRTIAELMLASMMSMLTAEMTVWKDDDEIPDENKWAFNWWYYQVKRTNFDAWASIPIIFSPNNLFTEFNTLINSPVSSTNTFTATAYPLYGWQKDWGEEVNSRARWADFWNSTDGKKYWQKVWRYTMPFNSQIEQTIHFDEADGVFKAFDNDGLR